MTGECDGTCKCRTALGLLELIADGEVSLTIVDGRMVVVPSSSSPE